MRHRTPWALVIAVAIGFHSTTAYATQCRTETREPVKHIALPGGAFRAIGTRDGCWVFVTMGPGLDPKGAGLAVLSRSDSGATLVKAVPGPPASGLALTHDERILIVAATELRKSSSLTFYDVGRLTSGAADPILGVLRSEGEIPGYFDVLVTPDDHTLFVSNHNTEGITVINLEQARHSGFQSFPVVGTVPTGWGPSSIALSSDRRWIYVSAQSAHDDWHWPSLCRNPGTPASAAPNRARGAIIAIDAARAMTDPAHSVVANVAAGCDPVRLALSPKGDRAYVTVRGDNTLLVFDTGRLVSDSAHSLVGTIRTHTGPVGLAVIDGGRRLAVANALRFSGQPAGSDSEVVMLISTAAVTQGQEAVIGAVASGGGPVDLTLAPDGKTLFVPNLEPRTLTLLQVRHLPSR